MRVSTRGSYALRMMVEFALCGKGEYLSLRDIAGRQGISVKYMEQIVSLLSRAGYLQSVRGPLGGYRLVRPPEEYRVGDILRATEGSLAPVWCAEEGCEECLQATGCTTRFFWRQLYDHITEYVDGVTLKDLAQQARGPVAEPLR